MAYEYYVYPAVNTPLIKLHLSRPLMVLDGLLKILHLLQLRERFHY